MFLKNQIFKNLITKAWKGQGLRIATTEETYYIASYAWALQVKKEVFPNKALASIIELIGEMPKAGETITAMKNRPDQYEMKETVTDLSALLKRCTSSLAVTFVLYQKDGKNHRILQDKDTGMIREINDVFVQIISLDDLMEDKESSPAGPFYDANGNHRFALWTNNKCIFAARFLDDPDPDTEELRLHEALSVIQLPSIL